MSKKAKGCTVRKAEDYTLWREIVQYWVIYFILYPFFKIFFRIKVYGRENIPTDRSIIVAANHLSHFDPVILALATRKPTAYMAKQELFSVPVLSTIIDILGAIAVDRKKLDVSTIKSAKAVLKTKWLLGIFPEGTRILTGKVGKIQKGFGYLAKMTNSEILPLGIIGSDTFPGKIIVRIGKPIPVPATPEEAIEKWGMAISELTGFPFEPEIDEEVEKEENAQA
ncbi:MAG: lysophospholipid acyltransferase family protein [bacterium]